ncbi:MAG: Ig domain-containing protein, partial [Clostridiales bacterium]|nr:Ig domain-containing protein [Clostridiales bacterium]
TRQMRQIDDNGWTKYTGPITGLRHNNIVLARLSDGTNATIYEYPVEIIDEDEPMPATGIENIETTANTNTGIEVTIVHNDDKSGIDLSGCRWVYNTTDTMLGIESEIWDTANEFTEGEPITLTASTPGEYYLHILSVDSAGNRIETMSEKVTVNQPVTKITLSRTSASLTTGGSTTIIATVEPENATNKTINWTTSNSSRATVSPTSTESGESVTIQTSSSSTGDVTITATTADGTNLSATCSISVSASTVSVTGISVNPTSVTLNVGGTKSLTATISPPNATNQGKTWTSSNNSVATVSGGTVRAVAPGPATITVTASGNTSKTATCSVSVNCTKCSNKGGLEECNGNCTVLKNIKCVEKSSSRNCIQDRLHYTGILGLQLLFILRQLRRGVRVRV